MPKVGEHPCELSALVLNCCLYVLLAPFPLQGYHPFCVCLPAWVQAAKPIPLVGATPSRLMALKPAQLLHRADFWDQVPSEVFHGDHEDWDCDTTT